MQIYFLKNVFVELTHRINSFYEKTLCLWSGDGDHESINNKQIAGYNVGHIDWFISTIPDKIFGQSTKIQ